MARLSPDSFRVNRLAGVGGLFPLGFDLREAGEGIWRADLHAQSVAEAAEIVIEHGEDRVCVFGVDHYLFEGPKGIPIPLKEVAIRQGVLPQALDEEVVLIRTTELPALLCNLGHYNLCLIDVAPDVDPDAALESVIIALDDRPAEKCVLGSLPRSSLFLRSHDDCYLQVESRSVAHLRDHLRCLLGHYASAKLGTGVPFPPSDVVEVYLAQHSSMTVLDERTELSEGSLRLPCSAEPFAFRETKAYPTAATLVLELDARRWSLEPRP